MGRATRTTPYICRIVEGWAPFCTSRYKNAIIEIIIEECKYIIYPRSLYFLCEWLMDALSQRESQGIVVYASDINFTQKGERFMKSEQFADYIDLSDENLEEVKVQGAWGWGSCSCSCWGSCGSCHWGSCGSCHWGSCGSCHSCSCSCSCSCGFWGFWGFGGWGSCSCGSCGSCSCDDGW